MGNLVQMKSILVLFLLCLVQGIANVPVAGNPKTAQSFLNEAQSYINGVPSAGGLKVPTTSNGNLVIKNPPNLPTTKTTTTKAPAATTTTTKAPAATTTTTKAPDIKTTTTEAPLTTTCAPRETTTSSTIPITCETTTTTEAPLITTTTTCAPCAVISSSIPTTYETTTTTEAPLITTTTTYAPSEAVTASTSTAIPIFGDTTTTTTTCEPSATIEVTITIEQFNELITQLLNVLSELIKVTNSDQTRQLIEKLISKLTGDGEATRTNTVNGDAESDNINSKDEYGKSNTQYEDAEISTHSGSHDEQLIQLITEITYSLSKPMTSVTIEEVKQLIVQLQTQSTNSSTTPINGQWKDIDHSTSEDGTAIKENDTGGESSTNTTESAGETHETVNSNDQLDLLLAQLKNLINEPITDTTREQIIQLMMHLSKLIDGNAPTGNGFENNISSGTDVDTTNTIGGYNMTTTNNGTDTKLSIIIGNQLKELFAQIIDLIHQPIISSAREQINELIRQIICLMTEGNGNIITSGDKVTAGDVTTTVENTNNTGVETIGTGGDHDTEIRSDVSTTTQPIVAELPVGDSNTATSSNAGAAADDAPMINSQISQLIVQLTSLRYEPSGSVDEPTSKLICTLVDILTIKNATTINEHSTVAEDSMTVNAKELIKQLINQTNQPIQISDSKYFNLVISELITELTGSQIGDITSENSNSTTRPDEDNKAIDENKTNSTINTTTNTATTISDTADQSSTRSDQISLLTTQLLNLINKPITTANSKHTNELVSQLISLLTSGNEETSQSANQGNSNATQLEGKAVCNELMKQIISEIKDLLTQPISYKSSKQMAQLVGQLIGELTPPISKTTNENGTMKATVHESNTTNETGNVSPKHSDNNYDSLKNRRASRRDRRKELASLRTKKNQGDTLKTMNGAPNGSSASELKSSDKAEPFFCERDRSESNFGNLNEMISDPFSSKKSKTIFPSLSESKLKSSKKFKH